MWCIHFLYKKICPLIKNNFIFHFHKKKIFPFSNFYFPNQNSSFKPIINKNQLYLSFQHFSLPLEKVGNVVTHIMAAIAAILSSIPSSSSSSKFSKYQSHPSAPPPCRVVCRGGSQPPPPVTTDFQFALHDALDSSGINTTHARVITTCLPISFSFFIILLKSFCFFGC